MSVPSSPLGNLSATRMRLREAVDDNPRRWRYIVVAVALAAAGLFYIQSQSTTPIVVDDLPRAMATTTPPAGTGSSSSPVAPPSSENKGTAVVVQVVGAVVSPGVYEMKEGDRVNDAVSKAGGMSGDADVVRVNLAAKLTDGQQVFVAKVGEAAPVLSSSNAASSAGPSVVNINSASVDELDTLPGIGPSLAAAIVSHRDKMGPFKSIQELNDVKGIGDSKFADLEDKVAV